MNFIVRASIDGNGQLHGIVLETRTSRKEQFAGAKQLCSVIEAMTPPACADDSLARLEQHAARNPRVTPFTI